MSTKVLIAVVEDNPPQRMILNRLLAGEYNVLEFESGEEFLASDEDFSVVLLDIGLPGVDGYEVCRRFRAKPGRSGSSVVFVSAHDTVEDRVAAYDAGGDDFLLKPITAGELRHKVRNLVDQRTQLEEMAAQSSNAQAVALNAMVNLGDQGVIIDFQRKTAQAQNLVGLAQSLVNALTQLGLRGAIQIRGSKGDVTLGTSGSESPLQLSVMEKLRDMGRIFEFGHRVVINYDHVSIVVQNMPVEDPQRMGRYRDHLAVLAESADISVEGVEAVAERNLIKLGLARIVADMRAVVANSSEQWNRSMTEIQNANLEMLGHLEHSLTTMGLSESQEMDVVEMVRDSQEANMLRTESLHVSADGGFSDLLARLESMAVGS